jgi:dethiobiotin synthetase
VLVSGTGTEVGKTWWACAAARELRRGGVRVAARKPTQSNEPDAPTDAARLAAATGEDPATVCPAHRSYARAWAPPFAADALGAPPFTIATLIGELDWPDDVDVGLVEGAGGPRSPLASDGDNVDLARELDPDFVVVVADAGLGTINAVRLAVDAFAGVPTVVALNRFDAADDLHAMNLAYLRDTCGFAVVTTPQELAVRARRLP